MRSKKILIRNGVNEDKLTPEQIRLLNACVEGDWEYENGIVNANASVNFHDRDPKALTAIPFQFGKVNGRFQCNNNQLTSLKGCPHTVGGSFYCHSNQLTSLEYMPTKIRGSISLHYNPFILNDKLFEDFAKIGKERIFYWPKLKKQLYDQIPIQFGVTNKRIINKIWLSYMNIVDGKSE